MVATARIVGFLLFFGLVTQLLSIAFFTQGGDNYASGNLVVSETKTKQTTLDNVNPGRKMGSRDYNNVVVEKETKKEIGEKYTRKPRMLKIRERFDARFVAFEADYKGPKHHPPKNN